MHTVREDPARRGLLYAGTQHGVYISFDDGEHWQKFNNGLPDVPVTDSGVEDNAMAIGTHGRSFYVMDDIAALRQFGLAPLTDVALFKPANAMRGLDRADHHLLPEERSRRADARLPRRQGPGRALVHRPAAAPSRRHRGGGGDDDGPRGPQGAPMAAGHEPRHVGSQLAPASSRSRA